MGMGTRCVIVGAGISGLLAGERLQSAGWEVLLLDKGKGVGGRMATRRIGQGRVDHGAQYFTARSAAFQTRCAAWEAEGVIRPWFYKRRGEAPDAPQEPCYIAPAGMTALPKHLAQSLRVRTDVQIVRVDWQENGWRLESTTGEAFEADVLLLTAPVPQSLTLAESGNLRLASALRENLAAVAYDPCVALLLTLDSPTRLPAPGGWLPEAGPIGWMADNRQKGISPAETTVTIQGSPAYSREAFDQDDAALSETLLSAASPWVDRAAIREIQVRKWRYSIVREGFAAAAGAPFAVLNERPLLLMAGDGFGGPRVEGAAWSGWAAAEAMLSAAILPAAN